MFLTDGGTEEPEDLFEEYNPNKTVCSVYILIQIFILLNIICCKIHDTIYFMVNKAMKLNLISQSSLIYLLVFFNLIIL